MTSLVGKKAPSFKAGAVINGGEIVSWPKRPLAYDTHHRGEIYWKPQVDRYHRDIIIFLVCFHHPETRYRTACATSYRIPLDDINWGTRSLTKLWNQLTVTSLIHWTIESAK